MRLRGDGSELKHRSHQNCEQVRSVEILTLQDYDNRRKFVCYLTDHICCGHICEQSSANFGEYGVASPVIPV